MSRLAVILAGVLLLTTSGCGQDAPSEPTDRPIGEKTMSPNPATDLALVVEATVAPAPTVGSGDPPVVGGYGDQPGLLISYRVLNQRDTPVVIVDRLPHSGATMNIVDEPDPLAVQLSVEGSVLTVAKGNAAHPEVDYTTAIQGSVVAAGATHEGRAFVEFPIGKYAGLEVPSEVDSWRLCLGVHESTTGLEANADDTVVMVPNGTAARAQVCSETQPLPAGANG